MNYSIQRFENHILIEVSGKVDKVAVISAASYIRKLGLELPQTVILDVDGLEDEKEMFYHAALINTVKKEIEQGGGVFRIRASRASIRGYLNMTGLERLFVFDESGVMLIREELSRDFQRC